MKQKKKKIFQHQQFVESFAELSESIRIASSVMTFAVICSLVFTDKHEILHKYKLSS